MIYFLICILAVYFNVFQNVNAFTGGLNYHLWQSLTILMHLLMFLPVMNLNYYIRNKLKYKTLFMLILIYVLVRFLIFDYAYGFFAHGDFDYLGNSIYDTIIGFFPVWLVASIKSIGFIYSVILSYKIFK